MLVDSLAIDSVPQEEVTVSTYRSADLGPVHIGEVTFQDELRLECEDVGAGFYVQLPISGLFESRHRAR